MFVQAFDVILIALTDLVIASIPVALPIIGIMIAVRIGISFLEGLLGGRETEKEQKIREAKEDKEIYDIHHSMDDWGNG